MKNMRYPYDLKKNGYSVLCFGGHPSITASLNELLPGIRLMKSSRRSPDTSSFGNYDMIVYFISNSSHSASAAVKNAARRAKVPYHQLVHKGAETAADEILHSLGVQ